MASVWSLISQPKVLVIVPEAGLEENASRLFAAAATGPSVGVTGNVLRVPRARVKQAGEGSYAMCPCVVRRKATSATAMARVISQTLASAHLDGRAHTATSQSATLLAQTEAAVWAATLVNARRASLEALALFQLVVGQPHRKGLATRTECVKVTGSVPASKDGPAWLAMSQLAREKPQVHVPTTGSAYRQIPVSATPGTSERTVNRTFVFSSTALKPAQVMGAAQAWTSACVMVAGLGSSAA